MSYNMMIGYDIYDCFTMEHFRLFYNGAFSTVLQWSIFDCFTMEHFRLFYNGAFSIVSKNDLDDQNLLLQYDDRL
jgi:hypothetical protein